MHSRPQMPESARNPSLLKGSTMDKPYGFPSSSRLSQHREFVRIEKHGRKLSSPHFVVYLMRYEKLLTDLESQSQSTYSKLGITVSRRVGSAVVRNRIKRHVREAFRTQRGIWSTAAGTVVIAKKRASTVSHRQVAEELEHSWRTLLENI